VGGNGLFDAVELDRNGALGNALLIGLDGATASKEAAAIADYGWSWRTPPARRDQKLSDRR
jgi:hypothetical protein